MLWILFCIVVVLVVFLIVGVRPYLDSWVKSATVEPFNTPNAAIVPADRTQTELLGPAYNDLPGDLQTKVNATEPVTVKVIEDTYRTDVAAAAQSFQSLQASVEQEFNSFQFMPLEPTQDVLAAAQATPLSPEAQQEAAEMKRDQLHADYAQLVGIRDNTLLDTCYKRSCSAAEAKMTKECEAFNEKCLIQYGNDIHRCLRTLNNNCNRSLLERCKDACVEVIKRRGGRAVLKQGENLQGNERLTSLSGSTTLHLTDEGNLELWYNSSMLWMLQTNPSQNAAMAQAGPYMLLIYNNGDMAIKNGMGIDIWHTNTWLDIFKAGSQNGPYQLTVGEKEVRLTNGRGDVLWKK